MCLFDDAHAVNLQKNVPVNPLWREIFWIIYFRCFLQLRMIPKGVLWALSYLLHRSFDVTEFTAKNTDTQF